MSPRERFIRIRARQLGLDPAAVIADAMGEGPAALHGGNSIGDNGSSFGPFQLHVGGALPASVAAKGPAFANAWANSKAGLNYALGQIAQVARGETGKQALADIVAKFERPSDIPGQIAARSKFLGQAAGPVPPVPGSGGQRNGLGAGIAPALGGLSQNAVRSMAAAALLQQSAATAAGEPPDNTGLLALAIARRQADAAQQTYGPQPTSGPVARPRQLPQVSQQVSFLGDTRGVKPHFLRSLQSAVAAIGGTKVRVTSGYRSPEHNAAVGGVPHSNHMTGDALDGEVFIPGRGWVPLGRALKGIAPRYGLRSGDQPGFFNGGPDPVHVDDAFNQR